MTTCKLTAVLGTALALAACGGGGDSSTAPPPMSVAFAAPYKALINAGESYTLTVSGTCGGTATFVHGPASAGTFEGTPALQFSTAITAQLTGCSPSTLQVNGTGYVDPTTYLDVASVGPGLYETFTPGAVLPVSVQAGNTAVTGMANVYTDSTKTDQIGTEVASYVVSADGSSTDSVLVTFIDAESDTSGQLLSTEQDVYRLTSSGTLTLLRVDLQASTTSTTHLVFTVN